MKSALALLAAALAATGAHAFSYLRLADTNYAVTNAPVAGEPLLAEWTQSEDQRFINIIHNETDRLDFVASDLVIEGKSSHPAPHLPPLTPATYDDTPTPFLEIVTPDDLYQLWSFGYDSPTPQRGLVRNLGQEGWCLAAGQSGPGKLTMKHCDAADPLQNWQFGEEPTPTPYKRGSSAAEVVARAICARSE